MNDGSSKKRTPTPRQPLTFEQLQQLLEVAKTTDVELQVLLLLALFTGMRRCELLGLKWTDLDLDQGTLQIQRILEHHFAEDYVEREPKTERALRQIKLSPSVLQELQQHCERQQRQYAQIGDGLLLVDWIFSGVHGQPMSLVTLLQRFEQICVAAGQPDLRFHDLRLTALQIRRQ